MESGRFMMIIEFAASFIFALRFTKTNLLDRAEFTGQNYEREYGNMNAVDSVSTNLTENDSGKRIYKYKIQRRLK